MNIKLILKKHHITLQRFANDIGLSRPTLDAYITQYEETGTLPKEKYKIIFDTLFSDDTSEEEFAETYSSLKFMVSRDEKIGVLDLDPEKTDTLMNIINNIKSDMLKENENPAVYFFINAIVNNYRDIVSMEALVEYFAILNGFIPEKEINQERKAYYANIYKCFNGLREPDKIKYDEKDYDAFLERCKEAKKELEEKEKKLEDSISAELSQIIKNYNDRGIHLDNVAEEEIVQELLKIFEKKSNDSPNEGDQ